MDDSGRVEDGTSADSEASDACSLQVFEEVRIPMRDGKQLSAWVRHASAPSCRQPAVVIQTPYDKNKAKEMWFEKEDEHPLFGNHDYAFVIVDWRGFFGSKQAAVPGHQPYGKDGYDTVEWVATQPWCDGHVGTWGVSALCVQQYRTAVERPPHLRAAVPIFCQMNVTYGQYYPGGVLRAEYFKFMSAYYGLKVVKQHPYEDSFWKSWEKKIDPSAIQVPMLLVSGWWDLYDVGTINDFHALLTRSDPAVRKEHRLLAGPWCHFAVGGESNSSRTLDEQERKCSDSNHFIEKESLAFFDKQLRGVPSPADQWKSARWIVGSSRKTEQADNWPPNSTEERIFYLTLDGKLERKAPKQGTLSFPYDPSDPSPTVVGATLLPNLPHGPRLQDDVVARKDALVFVTRPWPKVLQLRGRLSVHLKASTSGADTDFAVRLTDVDENGKHLLLAEGIRRLKLRNTYDRPVSVSSGTTYELTVPFTSHLAYDLPKGHRLGIIVTSSNYPRFARNPNTGDDFYDQASQPRPVTNTIEIGNSSKLIVSVVP